jgi:hypothetical protein
MARPAISFTKLNETLQISEHHDGWWLYDFTQGMNLGMRAKTKDDAFVEALTYYQERMQLVEKKFTYLESKVRNFVRQFEYDDDDD